MALISGQRLADGSDHAILVGVAQIRVQRKTEDFTRGRLSLGKITVGIAKRGKDRLLVEALGIVNRRGYSFLFELICQSIAIWDSDCVLRVDVGVPITDGRSFANVTQCIGIAGSDAVAGLDLLGEARPFCEHDGGLERVEAAVHSDEVMEVAADAAVGADGAHFCREFVVVCEERAALAVASERLGGVEARAGDGGDIAAFATVARRAEALGGIFDDSDAVPFCDGIDGVVVRHLTKEAHGEEGFGGRRDRSLDTVHSDIEIQRVDIHEDRFRADLQDNFRSADPGEGNGEHLVAGADLKGTEGDLEAVSATGHGDRVLAGEVIGKGGFEFLDLGAHDEAAVFKNGSDAIQDIRLEFFVLGFEIDEIHESGVAGVSQDSRQPCPDDLRRDRVIPYRADERAGGSGEPPGDLVRVEIFCCLDIHHRADAADDHVGKEARQEDAALEALLTEGDGIVHEKIRHHRGQRGGDLSGDKGGGEYLVEDAKDSHMEHQAAQPGEDIKNEAHRDKASENFVCK